jgi:hypothetical protein
MECDSTCLNHNSLLSQKKSDHQGHDYKGGLLYIFGVFNVNFQNKSKVRIP